VEYAGALYHVMSRGDRGEAIFRDDGDRELFLKTLGETCARTGWRIHAYVLMSNHYHLLLGTPEANLVLGMKWLLSTYTLRYNARHRQCGHVFQGRYKTVMIEPEERGFTERVSTYIHLNPLRAGLVRWPEERLKGYRWSSCPVYMRKAKKPDWLEMWWVLDCVGLDEERRGSGRAYEAYIEKYCEEWATEHGRKELTGEWKAIRRGWYLGGDVFREKLMDSVLTRFKGKKRETYGGEEKRAHDEWMASVWLAKGLAGLGLSPECLSVLRKGDKRKQVLGWYLSRRTSVGAEWISDHLVMGHRTSVSKASGLIERGNNSELNHLRKKLEKILRFSD